MSTLRINLIGAALISVALLSLAGAQPVLAQCSPTDIFFDDMENGINGWTTYVETQGVPTQPCPVEWKQDNTASNSPATAWNNAPYSQAIGTNGDEACINYVESPSIVVPIGTSSLQLTFWHRYITEDGFDFGLVEVSDDGTTWDSVSPAYQNTSEPGSGLQFNQETLVINPANYTPGGSFSFRYRFYSDQLLTTGGGWWVDDVTLTACVEPVSVETTNWGHVKRLYASETE